VGHDGEVSTGPLEEFTVAGGDGSDGGADGPAAGLPGSAAGGPLGGGAGDPERPQDRRPWRGPLPWVGCAVVILLLGLALAGPLRTPVGPWGQVADATSTPQHAWTLEPAEDLRSVHMVGGVLVTTSEQTVRGLDPASGDQLWQVADIGGQCTSDTSTLLCTDARGGAVRIDPATGTSTELELTGALVVAESGGDLFAITDPDDNEPAGRNAAQLQRISDGQVLWSTPVTIGQEFGAFREPMAVIAGHVLTTVVADPQEVGSAGAVFDAETGEEITGEQPYVAQLGPGAWALLQADASTLYVRGEEGPVTTDGVSQRLHYDDQWDSDDVVSMTEQGVLTVRDRQSGELRWRSEGLAYPIARIDGVLFVLVPNQESATLQGVRVSSGELLWQKENSWLTCPCVGDRSTLAGQLRELAPSGGMVAEGPVAGIDAQSGEQLWQVEAPAGMVQLVTDGEHMVLVAPGQLAGFRLG